MLGNDLFVGSDGVLAGGDYFLQIFKGGMLSADGLNNNVDALFGKEAELLSELFDRGKG